MNKLFRVYILFIALFATGVSHALVVDGTTVLDFDGSESWMYGYDNSTINVNPGAMISWLYGYNSATLNISGGVFSWLILNDSSVANITSLQSLSWLLVNDDSEVNIYGSEFSYSSGVLSGAWEDGASFQFWALEEVDLQSGNITDVLPDNIRLHSVSIPEPGSILLMSIGLVLLVMHSKREKASTLNRPFYCGNLIF